MNIKHYFCLILSSVILSMGSFNVNAGKGHEPIIIVADWYSPMPYTLEKQAKNHSFEKYMKRHPRVKIKPFSQLQVTGTAANSGKLMSVAGGTPPDIWRMWFHETLKYANQGFLVPLNQFIGDDENGDGKISGSEVKFEPWRKIPDEFKAGCVKNGKIFALPYMIGSIQALCYRTDLFREAGLDPHKTPLSWNELWRYAQKLTFKPGEVHGKPLGQRGLYFMGTGYLCFNPIIWASGGDLVLRYKVNSKTGKTIESPKEKMILTDPETGDDLSKIKVHWKAGFDTPEGMAALKFLHKLRWQKWAKDPDTREPFDLTNKMLAAGEAVSPFSGKKFKLLEGPRGNIYTGVLFRASGTEDDSNIQKVIADGRIGMFFGYNVNINRIVNGYGLSPEQFGIGPMPVRKGCKIIGSFQPVLFGISLKKRSPEATQTAWNILVDFTSKKNLKARTKIMVEGGKGRLVFPGFLREAGYTELYNSLPTSWRNIEKLIQVNRTEPFNKGWTEVQSEITPAIVEQIWETEDIDLKKLLKNAAINVSAKFEKWPEAKMAKWRPWAWLMWISAMTLFILACCQVIKSLSAKVESSVKNNSPDEPIKKKAPRINMIYIWVLPALLTILLWKYYPLIRGSLMAFEDYKIAGGSTWVGIDNFIMIFGNKNFYWTLIRTFYYVGLTVSIGFIMPIFLAVLLTEIPRFKYLFRTMFYLPAVTSGLVIMFMWKRFYDPSSAGFLNSIVIEAASWIGIQTCGFKWLQDPKLAMICIIIPGVWATAGASSLIYQAALTSVPSELYEAADVDGASILGRIRHITFPTIKPLIVINFVGVFIGAFHAMQNIFVMTGGGPFNATRVIGIDIWFNAFVYLKFGFATAMAWVLGIMLIGFTVMQLKILSKVEFRKAEEN
jgi:ABC-type sugar transport system permease subunit/ABC-type glycerol-3-phosphate transport system substrate-binding protein